MKVFRTVPDLALGQVWQIKRVKMAPMFVVDSENFTILVNKKLRKKRFRSIVASCLLDIIHQDSDEDIYATLAKYVEYLFVIAWLASEELF
jgi:hypothetical protein